MSWFKYDAENNLVLTLHVQPGAKNTEVIGLHGDALKLKLAAAPVDGKANAALLKYLATRFQVSGDRIILKHGDRSRHKVVLIQQSGIHPGVLFKT